MEYDVKLEPPTLSDFNFHDAHVKTEVPNLFENASGCEQQILDALLSEDNKLSVPDFKDECELTSRFSENLVSTETNKKSCVFRTATGFGALSENRLNLDALLPGDDQLPVSNGEDGLGESSKIEKNPASTEMNNNSGIFRMPPGCSVDRKPHNSDVPLPEWNVEDASGQIEKNPALPETSNPGILGQTPGDDLLSVKQNMLLNSLVGLSAKNTGQAETSPRKVGSNSADAAKRKISKPRSAGIYCPVCQKLFRHIAALKSHISPGPNKLVYKCPHCGECFLWTSEVLRHLNKHRFSTSRDVTVFEIETKRHEGLLLRYCNKCPFHCMGAKNFLLHFNKNHREHCKSDMPYNLENTKPPTNNPTHCNSSASSPPANLMNQGGNSALAIVEHPATGANKDLATPTNHIADCSSNPTYCSADASVATANMATSSCNLPLPVVGTEYSAHCSNNASSMSTSPINYSKNTSLSTIVNTVPSANKDLAAKTEQLAHCGSNSMPTNSGPMTPLILLLLLPPPDKNAGHLALQSNSGIPTRTEPTINNNALSGKNSLNTKPPGNETLMVVDSKQPKEPDKTMVNTPGLLCTVCGDLFPTADTFKAHFRPAPDCLFYCCSLCKAFFKYKYMIESHMHCHEEKTLFIEVKRQYHGFKIFWFCDRCEAFFENGKTLLRHFNTKHCDLEEAGSDGIEAPPVAANLLSFNPAGSTRDDSKSAFDMSNTPCNTRQSSNNIQCGDMQSITIPEVGTRRISEDTNTLQQNIIDDKAQGGISQDQTNISMEISNPVADELDKNVGFANANAMEDNFQTQRYQNSLARPPLICELCGKIFRQLFNLKQHMRSHTNETPFVCRFCGKEFRIKVNLKNHEASHTGLKSHHCHECGKAFTRKHALGKHFLNIHRNSKTYRCSYCTKWFTQKLQLDTHLLKHRKKGFNYNMLEL